MAKLKEERFSPRLVWRTCEALLALAALWPIRSLAVIFARRLTYPMDLEWCEGGGLYMAYRVLHHLPVYVRPGDVFAPFPYPPAHTLALALAGALAGGLDYAPGRLVSIACFAIMCTTFYDAVQRQFDDPLDGAVAGLTTVGLVACAYPSVGGWYDLIRVDSMTLAFSVLGAALIGERHPRPWRIAATAAALTVAVYTKQTAAFFAAWVCLYAIVRNWREGLRVTGATLVFCSVALGGLDVLTRGQFWFWIFENLTSHAIHGNEMLNGFGPILRFGPFIPALPLMFVGLLWNRQVSAPTILWFGMLVAAVPAALLPYAKTGGWLNDLIPVIVLVAPVTLMLASDLFRDASSGFRALRIPMAVAAAAFLWCRPVSVDAFVPDAQMWHAAESLNRLAATHAGGLLVPQLAFTPARNGQTNPHWHRMGHADLEWSGRAVDEDLAVVRSQAQWALLNTDDRGTFGRVIRRRYRLVGGIPQDERVRMITGGGAVNLDQLWERLPPDGWPASTPPR